MLRFIGDVHGAYGNYRPLLEGADHTIQVGDLGFDYTPLGDIDVRRHRAIAGNHDYYGDAEGRNWSRQPIFLGDFGMHEVPGFPPIFFARGAWSIDGQIRRDSVHHGYPVSWWPEEELSEAEMDEAREVYAANRPAIVVTHEAPLSLVPNFTDPEFPRRFGHPAGAIPTRTSGFFESLLTIHLPKLWVFGHYHRRWSGHGPGGRPTRFVALDMLRGLPWGEAGAILDIHPEDF